MVGHWIVLVVRLADRGTAILGQLVHSKWSNQGVSMLTQPTRLLVSDMQAFEGLHKHVMQGANIF